MDTKENRTSIVKLISDNIDVLYDKDKNRIWKIISHQLQVSSGITIDWTGIRKIFKSSILFNLGNFHLPEQTIKQIRFPFLEEYYSIQILFEDKPYDSKPLGPRYIQRANIYVQYKLSKKYSEQIYENISSTVRGISSCLININNPKLNVNSSERISLKKFCKKSPRFIRTGHIKHRTPLSPHWVTKRKLNIGESESLAFQPPKKVARTVLKDMENRPCGDDVIQILSSDDNGSSANSKAIEVKNDTVSTVNIETPSSQVVLCSLLQNPMSKVTENHNLSKPADLPEVFSEEKKNLQECDNKSIRISNEAVSCDGNAKSEKNPISDSRLVPAQLEKACATDRKVFVINADILSSLAVDDEQKKVLKRLERICLNTPRFRLYVDPDRMDHFNSVTSTFDYDEDP